MYIFCHGIDGMVSTYPFGKFQFLVVQVYSDNGSSAKS